MPFLFLFLPLGPLKEMSEPHVLLHVVLVRDVLEILENLPAGRIVPRPARVAGEGELQVI